MIPYALAFIENQEGKFLLQLRDNKPNIFFPNHWGLFGGEVKSGETFKEGLIREIKEEIGVTLSENQIHFLFDYSFSDRVGKTFYAKLNIMAKDIILTEGQEARFFTVEELLKLKENILPEIKMFQEKLLSNL